MYPILCIHVYIRVQKFVRYQHECLAAESLLIFYDYVIFREFRNFPEIPAFYCHADLNTREMLCNAQLEKMFNAREQFP